MSLVSLYAIRCDQCFKMAEPQGDRDEALMVASALGWQTRLDLSLCPSCRDPRCKGTLGSRPSWMGVDQYDPCRCRLDRDHDGPHWCEHLGSPDPRTTAPAASSPPSPAVPEGENE